jgi:hypothetical protein
MGQKNGLLGTPRDSEISPRRVERGRWSGVETGAFGGQGGASCLLGWAVFFRLLTWHGRYGRVRAAACQGHNRPQPAECVRNMDPGLAVGAASLKLASLHFGLQASSQPRARVVRTGGSLAFSQGNGRIVKLVISPLAMRARRGL